MNTHVPCGLLHITCTTKIEHEVGTHRHHVGCCTAKSEHEVETYRHHVGCNVLHAQQIEHEVGPHRYHVGCCVLHAQLKLSMSGSKASQSINQLHFLSMFRVQFWAQSP
jgi:hypothetical protein